MLTWRNWGRCREKEPTLPKIDSAFGWRRRATVDAKAFEEQPRRELTSFIAGAEDMQTSPSPLIFLTGIDGNRYEIPYRENPDFNSRRISQQGIRTMFIF